MFRKSLAEFVGTFLMVFFGCASVCTATFYNAQVGIWQIAIVWGLAITFAIFLTGAVSGGHLNPAMTLAFAVYRRLPWREVVPYWTGQFAGAFCAAALVFVIFEPNFTAFEAANDITRGTEASVQTARCFGEYYKDPVPMHLAFLAEMIGTAILALVVFGLIDHRNPARPAAHTVPFFIGLTISALISIIAPLTQAGFNPARDFAPRLFAYLAGWESAAIPGPNGNGFWIVYIIAPLIGGLIGGLIYDVCIRPALPKETAAEPPG
jgi:glycerol uptake facilitator protein